MKKEKKTLHHIIPLSRQKEFETDLNIPGNITVLDEKIHNALHQLFSNMLPQEQLKLLYKINKKVINQTACHLYEVLIEMKKDDFYKFK